MVLNTGDSEDKPVVENNMQFFVLRPEPANANVYVDDEQVPIENGLFSATMPKGEHTYRVEAPMYQPEPESLLGQRTGNQECHPETQVRLRRNLLTARTGCRRLYRQRSGR